MHKRPQPLQASRDIGAEMHAKQTPAARRQDLEVAARIASELFEWLDGPVRRIASKDTWVAYAPALEGVILPQMGNVLQGIVELARY